ncbi:MAG: HD-GYP domain-containing protein [Proteocatella sp.]
MKAFMLDGFLDFSYFFDDYIRKNPILEKSPNIQFFVYNPDYTGLEYVYNSTVISAKNITFQQLTEILDKDAQRNEGFVYVHTQELYEDIVTKVTEPNPEQNGEEEFEPIVKEVTETKFVGSRIFVSALNPIVEKKSYSATMCINFDTQIDYDKIIESINFGHIEHFLFHLQAMITNYEKLYYIIDSYCEMLSTKDSIMPNHMSNVADWCNKISAELEMGEKDRKILYVSALLHDIGKMFIPDVVINKTTKLSDKEAELIKTHATKSYFLLKSALYGMTYFNDVPTIVKHHHERFDGTGYPDRLLGNDIPYMSRILAVADSIDGMMTRRPGKPPKEAPEIIEELAKESGLQFDPLIVNAAINSIKDSYENTNAMVMKQSKFIGNASLRFYFGDYKTIISLQGNLIIKQDNAIFIPNSSSQYNKEWNVSRIFLPAVSFIENKDLYEFKCTISAISPENIEISKIAYTPTDKFFSLTLNENIILKKGDFKMGVEMLKLGGDTLVLQVNQSENPKIAEHLGGNFEVYFMPELGAQIGLNPIDCRIGKIYNSGENTIYVLNYVDISSSDRDVILKYLFKKQIENKQNVKKAK